MKQSNQFGVPAPKAGAVPTMLHLTDTMSIIHDNFGKINHIIVGRDKGNRSWWWISFNSYNN